MQKFVDTLPMVQRDEKETKKRMSLSFSDFFYSGCQTMRRDRPGDWGPGGVPDLRQIKGFEVKMAPGIDFESLQNSAFPPRLHPIQKFATVF